jgi:hypothetical protein
LQMNATLRILVLLLHWECPEPAKMAHPPERSARQARYYL